MGLFNRSSKTAPAPNLGDDMLLSENPVFDQKEEIIKSVRMVADALGRRPTLIDYLAACKSHLPESTEWNPKIWADLSGQNMQGFEISDPSKVADTEHVMARLYDQFGE